MATFTRARVRVRAGRGRSTRAMAAPAAGAPKQAVLLHDISYLQNIVDGVRHDPAGARGACARFKAILEEYQEQPQLLDAHLAALTSPLTAIVSDASGRVDDGAAFADAMHTCRLLHALLSTRGHKTVSRFFPNQPADFERALLVLLRARAQPSRREVDEDQQDGAWQTAYVALMWLASLAMLPFDLSSLDVSAVEQFPRERLASGGAAAELLSALARGYLADPGPCRFAAAIAAVAGTASRAAP